ncbi:DUF6515 family protein [Aquimarina sp. 2201CG5-10]|uniref:DUF6515 family protein n=1 Tax=Aquimarina callyspongiae TaxID=3098150 RepID=UPI002AB5517B|nr:DUF6515 family protein [Aquimarina sp. 2201CG5-10]MDY8134310.1 DUF6515 family protein [Aquimarina sp. 2201CG5-10]
MRVIRIITILSVFGALFMNETVNAQRKVVVRGPKRTVVRTTSQRVVYRRPVPIVRAVRTLPSTTVVIKRNGIHYHYHRGLYYRYYGGRYVVVTAPIGIRVKILPVGHRTIVLANIPYYYYQGTYYIESNNGYKTIEAPENIIVHELPEDAEQLEIDGKNYFEYGSTLYKVVTTPEGKAFKVVGNLEE